MAKRSCVFLHDGRLSLLLCFVFLRFFIAASLDTDLGSCVIFSALDARDGDCATLLSRILLPPLLSMKGRGQVQDVRKRERGKTNLKGSSRV